MSKTEPATADARENFPRTATALIRPRREDPQGRREDAARRACAAFLPAAHARMPTDDFMQLLRGERGWRSGDSDLLFGPDPFKQS